jgi:hypothetical protein
MIGYESEEDIDDDEDNDTSKCFAGDISRSLLSSILPHKPHPVIASTTNSPFSIVHLRNPTDAIRLYETATFPHSINKGYQRNL